MTDLPKDYNLKLFGELGQPLDASANTGLADDVVTFDNDGALSNQLLFVLVEGNGTVNSTTPYKLKVELLPCSDTYEPNNYKLSPSNPFQTLNANPVTQIIESYIQSFKPKIS